MIVTGLALERISLVFGPTVNIYGKVFDCEVQTSQPKVRVMGLTEPLTRIRLPKPEGIALQTYAISDTPLKLGVEEGGATRPRPANPASILPTQLTALGVVFGRAGISAGVSVVNNRIEVDFIPPDDRGLGVYGLDDLKFNEPEPAAMRRRRSARREPPYTRIS